MLAKLDSLATVSSARIVEHNFVKKRQKKSLTKPKLLTEGCNHQLICELLGLCNLTVGLRIEALLNELATPSSCDRETTSVMEILLR